jgi:hypothetical protein
LRVATRGRNLITFPCWCDGHLHRGVGKGDTNLQKGTACRNIVLFDYNWHKAERPGQLRNLDKNLLYSLFTLLDVASVLYLSIVYKIYRDFISL